MGNATTNNVLTVLGTILFLGSFITLQPFGIHDSQFLCHDGDSS